ncbi:hypothetical protein [Acaryochloris sp. CCMEE 5410]|uniref:hypothetical protein n=1 Tax=Acaryochloris sp. CCMEE 5410 TaxID=310037 RepID=UPI0002485054|nr:hypothetical protein [Acaryochloris sp. CCMEE 5410]KAI9129506.1 hypothetical protein ON05_032855 [Acaryochloris sp. CCMEE 5410]
MLILQMNFEYKPLRSPKLPQASKNMVCGWSIFILVIVMSGVLDKVNLGDNTVTSSQELRPITHKITQDF